jgi:outer membrane protein TolC
MVVGKQQHRSWAGIALGTLFAIGAQGVAAQPMPIDLHQVLARGAQHTLTARANLVVQGNQALAEVARRQASWPTVSVSAVAEQTSALVGFNTPVGRLEAGDRSQAQAQASVRLPLYNKSANLRAAALADEVQVAQHNASRIADSNAMIAAGHYLDILRLRALITATQNLQASLQARSERNTALLEAGKILKSDLLRVKLEVAQTAQELVRLQGQLAIAGRALAYAIGIEDEMTVLAPAALPELMEPSASQSTPRDDIAALRAKITSLSKSVDAVAAEQRQPNLDFVLKHDERRRTGLFPDRETAALLYLTVPLFNAGTTAPRQLALLRERDALALTETDIARNIKLDLERNKTLFDTARSLRVSAQVGIESARANVETRRAQYEIGRLQIDEVLSAEAELAKQQALFETAAIDMLRAWLEYQHAAGQNMANLPLPGASAK